MARVKRGNIASKKHKKILKITKGFRGSSSKLFRTANQRRLKALSFSYRDRKQKKRYFRTSWITRLNAASRFYGINYNELINLLKKSNVNLNRKILSQLSIHDQNDFTKLIISFS
jgi:large subunit ribosomal protein L20